MGAEHSSNVLTDDILCCTTERSSAKSLRLSRRSFEAEDQVYPVRRGVYSSNPTELPQEWTKDDIAVPRVEKPELSIRLQYPNDSASPASSFKSTNSGGSQNG